MQEYGRLMGVRQGSANAKGVNQHTQNIGDPNNSGDQMTQTDVARVFGVSVDTVANYNKLINLQGEVLDSIQDGRITPTTGIAVFAKLSADEQKEFLAQLLEKYPEQAKITQRQVQAELDERFLKKI